MSFAGDEFMRDLWRGKIPVQFTLAEDSMAGMPHERPPPFYKLVPRVSYLAFAVGDVKSHFAQHLVGSDADVWFSRDYDRGQSEVVRWHLPVGVIFDWFVLKEGASTASKLLPLQLRVHFTSFPGDKIMRMSEREAMDGFNQSLKQSHMIRYSSCKAVTELPAHLWSDLTEAIKECNYAKYATVRKDLQRGDAGQRDRRLPIFVHLDDSLWLRSPPYPEGGGTAEGDGPTLGSFLRQYLGSLFPLSDEDCAANREPPDRHARVLVHGVAPFLNTPLLWLVEYMSHPDGFLHLIVRSAAPPPG